MLEPVPITPDGSLLRQVAGGDSAAAQQLYDRHFGSLYALAYGLLMDPADADAVVEETFNRAWQGAAEFDPAAGAAYAWLSGIARTLARTLAVTRRGERRSRAFKPT
jgi:DNA-directed RNA polymerase specialized sigma24 family protein